MSNPESSLPPGFRFHPTDEELILHYLRNRATSTPCPVSIIAEVDIYKFDPWELPARAAFGEKEWYFFSPRDRKYPNGARPNRAAASGYWKATGTDKPILATAGHGQENIGVKKALVFYKGRPPKGLKTNWIMHEYRLAEAVNRPIRIKDSSMRLDDWVLCRIYKKTSHLTTATAIVDLEQEDPSMDDVFLSTIPNPTDQKTLNLHKSPSLSNSLDVADYSFLSRFMLDNLPDSSGSELCPILNYNNIDQPINNNNYLLQRLPQTELSVMDNQLKRQRSAVVNQDEGALQPSKKYSSSCTFTNFTNQFDTSQYHLLNQNLFNQQILLNSHLQFQ